MEGEAYTSRRLDDDSGDETAVVPYALPPAPVPAFAAALADELTTTTTTTHRDHPVNVYLATLAPSSRRVVLSDLTHIARILHGDGTVPARSAAAADADDGVTAYSVPWERVRYLHAVAIRRVLAERYAHTGANRMLSSLRGVLKACWRLGLLSAEEYHTAASVEPISGTTLPAGREITAGERAALMEACLHDRTALGQRDAALLALLYGCGLRREEASSLNLDDYDAGQRSFRLVGKRNKERMVYVSAAGAAEALTDWLTVRCAGSAGCGGDAATDGTVSSGPVFVGIRHGGHLTARRLTANGIYQALLARAAQAGIDHLTPHDFRRTFVGDLLDRGADLATVQKMAGHANVTTTARYDRRPEEAKKKAAALLHVPYVRRVG